MKPPSRLMSKLFRIVSHVEGALLAAAIAETIANVDSDRALVYGTMYIDNMNKLAEILDTIRFINPGLPTAK